MDYGQFCPVAKAAEVLGERWSLLVLRELLAGATRFGELQRALGRVSPSVLTARLKELVEHGIVERTSAHGSVEYRLTEAGRELAPIVEGIGVWGQRWVRSRMTRDELDVELLMIHLARCLDAASFPKAHGVVAFTFTDLRGSLRQWWVLVEQGRTELCPQQPGRREDIRLSCTVRTLAGVFIGDITLSTALAERRLETSGTPQLVRTLERWLKPSPFAHVPRAIGA